MTLPAHHTSSIPATASDIDRRTLVTGAAWMVPVIAAAVATPLAAASAPPLPPKDRIKFTNVTATVGARPNTIYVNTTVQVIDGPDPVHQIMLTITLSRDGQTFSHTWPLVAGWGNTGRIETEFPSVPRGSDVTVTFTAWAIDVKTITAQTTLSTPSWWG